MNEERNERRQTQMEASTLGVVRMVLSGLVHASRVCIVNPSLLVALMPDCLDALIARLPSGLTSCYELT